ncbi:hypothetical protein PYW08_006487 [Mythimna loreyi]|nr:hypothetical protein PYW08_006487 [Mythimna loreyi]
MSNTKDPKELLNILEDTAALLQKTQINLKKCPKSRLTKGYIETRIIAIEDYWCTFKNTHQSLAKVTPKEQRSILPYFVNEEFYIYEDLYLIMLADLRDMLNEYNTAPSTSSQNNTSISTNPDQQNTLVRLPRIQLPSFSGKYEEWPTFQDLFTSLVHTNTNISDVQKLHYLKCSVTGEAETLLKHIQVTQKNYEQAWDLLKTRYGNKRLIVNSVLKQLVHQKKMSSQSPNLIKSLLDTTTDCLNNLQNLNICVDSWDPIIIFLVVQKLDPESHKDWEQYSYKEDADDLPKWNDLKRFLQSTYRTLELVTPGTQCKTTKERAVHVASTSSSPSGKTCVLCNENHTLCHCKQFTKLQPSERLNYVKTNNLCFNCLVPGHSARKCRLPVSCRICKRRHHSLLHQNKEPETSVQENSAQPKTAQNNVEEQKEVTVNTTVASHHTTTQGIALLATATVTVRNQQNHTVVLRALVDQGSQIALISEKATQMLNLKKRSTRGSIIGVGSAKTNVNHVVQLQIGSRWDTNFKIDVEAFVMSKQLTTKLPPQTITADNWAHLEGLNLADSNYATPGPIDLLLGVKQYSQILQEKLIKGPPGTPCAQKTYLGWILFGDINIKPQDDSALVLHHQVDMDVMLKSLWEIDTENKRNLTKEEKLCETIYEETHTRTEEGRYMVKLPLKTSQPTCIEGNTKEIALKRLLQLERKFRKTPNLKENYKKVMKEYLNYNYMEEIPEKEVINERVVYLPHHAVIREDKETSKTRVVFDASAKGSNLVSLNDELMVGPQLQEDLRNIIMRWRMKRICYASDITKMYLQICVFPEDANKYQRILWRDEEHESIKEYRLLRVTFGTASAPYLAVKTLHQVADDEGQHYPNAVKIIKENFLVDDLLAGEDTTEKAITSAREVSHILKKGGFTLSKWSSNCPQFMKSIDKDKRSFIEHLEINKMDSTVKALGLIWNLRTDQFQYQWKLSTTSDNITKRTILSDVQRLFDPLGWLAPSIVMAKMFIQRLWLEKIDWDDMLSPELQEEWMNVREEFRNVNKVNIDRWLGTYSTDIKQVQIHGFSDASMKAYAAAAYIRIESQNGNITTQLLAARTRLAPLKTVSLPRLELSGSLLLSRLMNQIGKAMRISTAQMFA